ncbi:chromate transporter [Amycolatopsis plumensis]|uniref:Chromate transporter n=1 Tax=Amycolatopsis plumensis TaxID=236508 RepID=A0ABV5UA04_9PSEU
MPEAPSRDLVPLRTATWAWFLISLQTFGGPAGQIAVMQRVLVEEKRWIGQQRFLHALNFCMLLPGPEAQQLAIYVGWLLNGRRGGVIAGTLFVLPGMFALLVLSAVYVAFGDTTTGAAIFAGLAPAVVAIVVQAVVRVGKTRVAPPCAVRHRRRRLRGLGAVRGSVPGRHRRRGGRRLGTGAVHTRGHREHRHK